LILAKFPNHGYFYQLWRELLTYYINIQ